MLLNRLTDEELLKVETDDPVALELKLRLAAALDKGDDESSDEG